ncbi:HAD family hydrolase [Moorena sp. SIO3H5]|uniref:HAD-IIB family hydrolase n=1 Tax=Moorena sp. SIO3H5 TaxID=2607834 RepID=UPI0013BB19BF|nr:HAD family hydrolase [Moorena sp. SIO3H5]NEO73032.1 HAD family phosphatase [Moorena sp. SIO3H5]
MSLAPLSEAFETNRFESISLIATDIDGTLTLSGKFTSSLFHAIEELAKTGIQVLLITGRSAGWVNGLKTYLPVIGAIAENGGIYFPKDSEIPEILTPIEDLTQHRQSLNHTFQVLKAQFPQLQESVDNRFRLTDWAFDVKGLASVQLQTLAELCQQQGWGFTYSTVQCHIKPIEQDKGTGLLQVLTRHFPQLKPEEIMTVGDSPNDESMFDTSKFPLSVGVANVLDYTSYLTHQPAYVTYAKESEGFCELAQLLLLKTFTG